MLRTCWRGVANGHPLCLPVAEAPAPAAAGIERPLPAVVACTKSQSRFVPSLCVSSFPHAFKVRPGEFALLVCGAAASEALEGAAEEDAIPPIVRALTSFWDSGGVKIPPALSHYMGALRLRVVGVSCARVVRVTRGAGGPNSTLSGADLG